MDSEQDAFFAGSCKHLANWCWRCEGIDAIIPFLCPPRRSHDPHLPILSLDEITKTLLANRERMEEEAIGWTEILRLRAKGCEWRVGGGQDVMD